jgi:hypothetical protein
VLAFQLLRDVSPFVQERAKVICDGEYAAVAVLRGVGIEPDFTGPQIDVAPFERESPEERCET